MTSTFPEKKAPTVTIETINNKIKSKEFYVFPDTTHTVCRLTLENGYTVLGESACASPENFNKEQGEFYAEQQAIGKIWQLEGYLLKERLFSGEVTH